jgi:hypothetical protein
VYKRIVEHRIKEAMLDTPAVLIVGPRRAGKTTLVREMATRDREYITLDDQTTLDAALFDPVGFVRRLDCAIIDEVQRAPALLLAIKRRIDEGNRPGRFLLTGSANVLTLPRVADSLAGRIETLQLLPLAQVEINGTPSTFLAGIFEGRVTCGKRVLGEDLVKLVLAGGFPEVIARTIERRRQDWCRSYLKSILARDLREIADIEKLSDLPKFVGLLGQHSGQLINYSEIGSGIGVNFKTSQRYVGLLEQLFLIATLRPWYTNTIKRIIRTPKLHFLDSAILATSRGLTFERIARGRTNFGPVLESFVFAEILKLSSGSDIRTTPYHFRDHQMNEVDILLERDDGMIVGIEVKAGATVTPGDFSGLKKLAEISSDKFAFGVVLYDAEDIVWFGDRLAAVPISCLWG